LWLLDLHILLHKGYLYCEECPVFDTRQVQWPIFERRSLSLQKQQELRRWMVDQAIRSAEQVLAVGSGQNMALEDGASDVKVWNPVRGLTWSGEANAEFFGEFSHQDRPRVKKMVYPKTMKDLHKPMADFEL
jgi:hypothetical protein